MPSSIARPRADSGTKRVGVVLTTGLTYTTEILNGLVEYAWQQGHWRLEVDSEFHFGQRPAKINEDWKGDGIILVGGERDMDQRLWRRRIPMVNATGWTLGRSKLPFLFWDDADIAARAFRHLHSLGLEHLAYVGPQAFPPSRIRADAFARLARRKGISLHRLEWNPREVNEVAIRSQSQWRRAEELFMRWMASLPHRPIGIFANNDITASILISAGQSMGWNCPQDFAVMGFWNDKVICGSTHPALTSIQMDASAFGRKAGAMLDDLMSNRPQARDASVLMPASKVIPRESTNILPFDDALIGRVLKQIRREARHQPVRVEQLTRDLPMSRSSFTARFRSAVGHSAKQEIQRIREEEAKRLLRQTDWTITRIAEEMGFESTQDFTRFFKVQTGMAPRHFRE